MNPNQSKDSFSPSNLIYRGHTIVPSKDIKQYPSFRLPNLTERSDILTFSKQCTLNNSCQK